MAKDRNYHLYSTTGYPASGTNKLNAPQMIKCNACDVVKGSNNYSTNKLMLLSEHISKLKNKNRTYDASVSQYIPCVNCTQKQVCELTCFMCDKTKGLDKFAKTQRKKPDQAECMKCVDERMGIEPDGEDSETSGDSGSSDEESSEDGFGGGADISDSVADMSLHGNSNGNGTSTGNTFPSSISGGRSTGGVGLSTNTYPSRIATSATSAQTATQRSTASMPGAAGFNSSRWSTKAPSSAAGSATSSKKATKKGGWAKPNADSTSKKQKSDSEDDEDKDVVSSESD